MSLRSVKSENVFLDLQICKGVSIRFVNFKSIFLGYNFSNYSLQGYTYPRMHAMLIWYSDYMFLRLPTWTMMRIDVLLLFVFLYHAISLSHSSSSWHGLLCQSHHLLGRALWVPLAMATGPMSMMALEHGQ